MVQNKIKKIIDIVNQNNRNNLHEAFKFKKSEQEIEDMVKEVELSADELTKQEYKTYDMIINKINKEINNIHVNNSKDL